MKIYNKYIALAAMALTFAACTQDEDFTPQMDGDAVKINATIDRLQTRVAYEADGATNFINGDEICVQNILRDTKNVATYTFDGTTWTTTDALVWNGGTAESQFQAWYPATASFDKFTLPTDQISIEELAAADWMTASTNAMVKPADKTINLAFEHKLAKITVEVTEFTSQFGDDPCLYGATIYSLSDEYVTVNGGIQPVLRGNAATAIVCPGKYAAGTDLMAVTISDSDRHQTSLNVPVNAFLTNTGLEAGKHYKFSLKVGKDAISITKVNVEPWTTKEIDGGMAEEVLFEKVSTAEEFTTAIEDGGKIKLMDNITLDNFFVSSDVVLDMNGYDITSKWMFNAEDCSIIISGDGTIKSNEEDPYVNLINAHLKLQGGTMKCTLDVDDGSTITVSGGSIDEVQIRDAIATISGGNIDMLQIRNSGNVYISGGNVSTLEYHGGTLIISGGTFGFDPTSYLADGYTATENEGIWTVAPSNN
ncbi:fimbrillin family protein [Phocaeicola vulgatus]